MNINYLILEAFNDKLINLTNQANHLQQLNNLNPSLTLQNNPIYFFKKNKNLKLAKQLKKSSEQLLNLNKKIM